MLDKMETRQGHLRGSMEHLEEKDGESDVAILSFLCGSPRLCRLRTGGLVPVSKYWTYRSHAGVYGPSKLKYLCNHWAETSLPYSKATAWEEQWRDQRRWPGQFVFDRQEFIRV
jgi:hypothetical protein